MITKVKKEIKSEKESLRRDTNEFDITKSEEICAYSGLLKPEMYEDLD